MQLARSTNNAIQQSAVEWTIRGPSSHVSVLQVEAADSKPTSKRMSLYPCLLVSSSAVRLDARCLKWMLIRRCCVNSKCDPRSSCLYLIMGSYVKTLKLAQVIRGNNFELSPVFTDIHHYYLLRHALIDPLLNLSKLKA